VRLFPAIDIQGGRCVRLRQGDFGDETVFGEDPVAMARHWVDEGARFLHVVDLDGAREGSPRNFDVVRRMAEAVPVPIEFGGGLRSLETLKAVAASGIARAVLGTVAIEHEDLLRAALAELGPDRLVVAVDAENGLVKTRGWQQHTDTRAVDLVVRLQAAGVNEVLYTDISRDGMMQSVNLDAIREVADVSEVEIIASGGVTTLDDLRALLRLEPLGVTGVIAGRALYEGRFTVREALAVLDSGAGAAADALLPRCSGPADVDNTGGA
jgi:phosphoribosylformimino-5-aminoimidazole carboxamide ribotide isomerase